MEHRSLTPDSLEITEPGYNSAHDPQAGSQHFDERYSGPVSPLDGTTHTSFHISSSATPYSHDTPMHSTTRSYEATYLLRHDADQAASLSSIGHNTDSTSFGGKDGAAEFSTEHPTKQPQRRLNHVPSWWWWEIAAAVFSIICMVLILVLLTKINNISLEDWRLPIQPNSIIAVLTTLGKASLMVPVAACISQVKWRHFQQREDYLESLQLFDDASRGPWGSAMMLLSVRTRAVLAWAFAFVTVAALGFDPTAQQILEFPPRTVELRNVTAGVGVATNYFSKAYIEGDLATSVVPNSDLLKLQSSMVNGASGQVPAPNFVCPSPASTCNWDSFTTLSLCSSFQNLTNVATTNCTGDTYTLLTCTYDFPGRYAEEDPVTMYYNQVGTTNSPPTSLYSSIATDLSDDATGDYVGLTAVRVTSNGMGETTPPPTEVLRSTWFWCAQTFHNVTAARGVLGYEAMESQKLSFQQTYIDGWQSYSVPNSSTGTGNNKQYNITTNAVMHLFDYFSTLLTRGVNQSALTNWHPANPQTADLDLGYYLYTSNLSQVTVDLATTVTNQIRSRDPGDNANATVFAGRAYFTETYVRVRWAWLVLPFATTVLAAGLLALAIAVSWGQPVLQGSVFPYVAYRFDESVGEGLRGVRPESAENMALAARDIRVRLVRDGEGRMVFVRTN